MAGKVVLYSFYRSSASWRVRIALALKKITYEYAAIDLYKEGGGQQHSEEYRKQNPMEQVPTLFIDGHHLIQSLPIIEYLEEKYPEPALLPKDSYGRAQVRALAEIVNSGIQPYQNNKIIKMVGENANDFVKQQIEHGFKAIESILAKTAGRYSFGDTVTLADIFLVPQILAATRFNVDLSQFPIIARVAAALAELQAFQEADYRNQPDTPEELRVK